MDLHSRLRELPPGERVQQQILATTTDMQVEDIEAEIRNILQDDPSLGILNSATRTFMRAFPSNTEDSMPQRTEMKRSDVVEIPLSPRLIEELDRGIIPEALQQSFSLRERENSMIMRLRFSVIALFLFIASIIEVIGVVFLLLSIPYVGWPLIGVGVLIIFLGEIPERMLTRKIVIDFVSGTLHNGAVTLPLREISGIQLILWIRGQVSLNFVSGSIKGPLYGLLLTFPNSPRSTILFRLVANNPEKVVMLGLLMKTLLSKACGQKIAFDPCPRRAGTSERVLAVYNHL